MEFRFWHFESTDDEPHYEVNGFLDGEWAGHYQRRGPWIENVFVSDEMRGKGICKKLMMHAISKRDETLKLTVLPDNEPAKRCYASVGFQVVGKTDDGLDIMERPASSS